MSQSHIGISYRGADKFSNLVYVIDQRINELYDCQNDVSNNNCSM